MCPCTSVLISMYSSVYDIKKGTIKRSRLQRALHKASVCGCVKFANCSDFLQFLRYASVEPRRFVLSAAAPGLLLVELRALQLRRRVRIKCAMLTGFPRLSEWTLEQSQALTQARTNRQSLTRERTHKKSDNDHFIFFVSNPHRPLSLSRPPRAGMAHCWNQRPIRFISCPLTQRPRGRHRETAKEGEDQMEGGEE